MEEAPSFPKGNTLTSNETSNETSNDVSRGHENDSKDDDEASEEGSDDASHDGEAELAIQKELTRKYERFLARCDQKTRLDQQVDLIVTSDELMGPLKNVDSHKVLGHMLQRTNERFRDRYGDILTRLGASSVEDLLRAALTPRTLLLLETLKSGSIGLEEYVSKRYGQSIQKKLTHLK